MINRFSEDIDITFNEHIGESRRKKLKNVVLKGISEKLKMPVVNWEQTQSDRDYNAYQFAYESVFNIADDRLLQFIKLEMALGSYSFPTQIVEISNYIGDYLADIEKQSFITEFQLDRFPMKLQSLERTYVDKVFAVCDYYMQGKSKRYSRHLYDIYKLTPFIKLDADLKKLVDEVRRHRAEMSVCPSAQTEVNVIAIMTEICNNDFYKEDYQSITGYFAMDFVSYDEVISNFRRLAGSGYFERDE